MEWYARLVAELADVVGSGDDDSALMSYAAVTALDEQEAYPEEFVAALLEHKIHHYYVPEELGGRFNSYEQLYTLGKLLAARDMSTTISMSTMIWTTIVWLKGDQQQKVDCAQRTLSGNGAPCLAYSEEGHGSDLIGNTLSADDESGFYRVRGEKWPINRATRSDVVILLAKTNDQPGPRSMSLFYFPKSVASGVVEYLPKTKTLGLRGCDISGLRFNDVQVPATSRIGGEGEGLESAILAFQITRTLCAALSLGALEGNLRITAEFALGRELYNSTVYEIPNAKYYLAGAFADLLMVDALGSSSSRALHCLPEEFSVLSAVTKFAAPYWLDRAHVVLSTVLGARFFLREKYKHGMFQKNLRDSKVVALFDGSSEVNLYSLSTQLTALAKKQLKHFDDLYDASLPDLSAIYRSYKPLPKFDGSRLDISNHGVDTLITQLPHFLKAISELPDETKIKNVLYEISRLLLDKHIANLRMLVAKGDARIKPRSAKIFRLAKQYCLVHMGVSAIGYWLHNQNQQGSFIEEGKWLVFALQRLLLDLNIEVDLMPSSYVDEIATELKHRTISKQNYQLLG